LPQFFGRRIPKYRSMVGKRPVSYFETDVSELKDVAECMMISDIDVKYVFYVFYFLFKKRVL